MSSENVNFTILNTQFQALKSNVDDFFIIVMSIIIVFMQGGFALLEAGSVRSKNTVNIITKNLLDCFIGGVAYWAIGWAVAYGPNGNVFCGGSNFFAYNMDLSQFATWFFQFVFAATTATIVSGAIAERCQFMAYFVYSIVLTGWVYPIVTHWSWDGSGWLFILGYQDFAGSGVVHLLSGVCSLVGCIIIGPRLGRFDDSGKPNDMPGHSVPLAALGGFILIFGFLAFNGGSQGAIASEGDSHIVALAIVNTILGGCSGGLIVLFLNKFVIGNRFWSYSLTLNGALSGMVTLCGGCNVYPPWAALLVGLFGGIGYFYTHIIMLKFKFDDPLDAVAIHGTPGIIGVLCIPFFDWNNGIFVNEDPSVPLRTLGINILGLLAIFVWSCIWSFLIFYPLKKFNILRVDQETEIRGSDLIKHGEAAYPAEAWVENQYANSESQSIPANMKGPNNGDRKSSINNRFEMGKIDSQMNSFTNVFSLDSNKMEENNHAYESNEN